MDVANPPTLLLVVRQLLARFTSLEQQQKQETATEPPLTAQELRTYLRRIYDPLDLWVRWLLRTQRGQVHGSFRWRGRRVDHSRVLPNTLASGLDDFPRGVTPSVQEQHLDMLSWAALAAEVMAELEEALQLPEPERSWVLIKGNPLSSELQTPQVHDNLTEERARSIHEAVERPYRYRELSVFLKSRIRALHWHTTISGQSWGRLADVGLAEPGERIQATLAILCGKTAEPTAEAGQAARALLSGTTQRETPDVRHAYAPVGLVMQQQHTLKAGAQKQAPDLSLYCPTSHPHFWAPFGDGRGGYKVVNRFMSGLESNATLQALPHTGYINLFPFLLRLLPTLTEGSSETVPNSNSNPSSELKSPPAVGLGADPLDYSLHLIEDPSLLWTEHGLRSIAKSDAFYQQGNAPGDAPYWRGPIWLPINYLALGALRHYGSISGPHQSRCTTLYEKLRSALLRTVLDSYNHTGFFWEHYDDVRTLARTCAQV